MTDLERTNGTGEFQLATEQKTIEIDYSRNVPKFYLFSFFLFFHTSIGVIVPFFMEWGQITFIEITILQSYFLFMNFLFEVPSGAIADYLGRKYVITIGAFAIALATLIYSSMPSIFFFAIGETFFALGEALLSGAGEAFLYDTLKKTNQEERYTKIIGRVDSFLLIGIMISGPIGSIIAEYISLQFTMFFCFFPSFCAALISLSFKEPNDHKTEHKKYLHFLKQGFIQIKNSKVLIFLIIDKISVGVLIYFMFWTSQLYLDVLNVPIIFFGFILSMMTFTEMVFLNFIPKFMKWFKKINTLLFFIMVLLE